MRRLCSMLVALLTPHTTLPDHLSEDDFADCGGSTRAHTLDSPRSWIAGLTLQTESPESLKRTNYGLHLGLHLVDGLAYHKRIWTSFLQGAHHSVFPVLQLALLAKQNIYSMTVATLLASVQITLVDLCPQLCQRGRKEPVRDRTLLLKEVTQSGCEVLFNEFSLSLEFSFQQLHFLASALTFLSGALCLCVISLVSSCRGK